MVTEDFTSETFFSERDILWRYETFSNGTLLRRPFSFYGSNVDNVGRVVCTVGIFASSIEPIGRVGTEVY